MTGKQIEVGDFTEEELMKKAIFGEEIVGLIDDDFERSCSEYQIFSAVFNGNKVGKEHFVVESNLNNRGSVGTGSEVIELVEPKNVFPVRSCENSTITNHSSVKNLSREDSWTVNENFPVNIVSASNHVQECSGSRVESDLGNLNTKRIKLLHIGNLDLDVVSGSFELDSVHIGQLITGPVVKYSIQGMASNCYPLKEFGSFSKLLPSSEDSNIHTVSPYGGDAKEVVQDKINMSPVSHESSVSKLLVSSVPVTVEEKQGALLCVEETTNTRCPESLLFISDSVNTVQKSSCVKNLRDHLRRQMKHLLVAAGWKIQIRRRKNRSSEDSVYIASGKKRTFCSCLPKAWMFCGERLLEGVDYSIKEDYSNWWVDINGFWSDLSDTLAHIEKYVQQSEQTYNSTSLRDWWILLDPFVTVALVEKLCRFKEGKSVKIIKGVLDYSIEKFSSSSECTKSVLVSKRRNTNEKGRNLVPEAMGSMENKLGDLDKNIRSTCQLDSTWHAEVNPCPPLTGESVQETAKNMGQACKSQDAHGSSMMFCEVGQMNRDCGLQCGLGEPKKELSSGVESEKCRNIKTLNKGTVESLLDREILPETGEKTQIEILNSKSMKNMENDFCNGRDMASTEWNFPKNRSKRITRSLSKANSTRRVLPFSSQLEVSFTKKSFAKDLATLNQGASSTKKLEFSCMNTSSTPSLMQVGAVLWDKSMPLDSNVELNGVIVQNEGVKEIVQERKPTSQPVGKLPRGGQLCGGLAIEQQMPFHLPQQEHGIDGAPISEIAKVLDFRTDVLSKDNLELLAHQVEHNLFQGEMTSEIGGPRKSHKKSKKPSAIKASKSCSQYTKDNPSVLQKVEENNFDCINLDRSQEDITHSQLKKGQKGRAGIRKNKNPRTADTSDESVLVADNGESPVKRKGMEHTLETSLVCMNDESVASQAGKKVVKENNCKTRNENGRRRSKTSRCDIDDDDLLVAAIIKSKELGSNRIRSPLKAKNTLSKHALKPKNQKGGCRLLPRGPGKGGKHSGGNHSTVGICSSNMRTVLSWLIDAGVLLENTVVQYRSPKDNLLVKDGWVTRDGLVCKCCNNMLSISEFKLHAGLKVSRPCLNLFLESGKSLTLCQLQAWSYEYKARKGVTRIVEDGEIDRNDDTCGLCGDGGDLICCDNCPSTFHQACLTAQELPEGSWYCPSCICKICGDVVSAEAASRSLIVLKCAQCEHKYHKSCVKEGFTDGEVVSDAWFCGQNCQEVYLGLHSRIGVLNYIDDGFSWTLLRCIHSDQKVHSAQRFALMAECNTKLAVALTIMEECFLPMVDPRTGIDMIPHVLYNWGSNFARLNYQGFYTVVLEKGDNLISVASIRIHGVTVAEIPLIATCSENRRQGMCRRLMSAIEEMLESYKVETLVISAIPALVDTWTLGFGYKPLEAKERFKNVNFMVFPGTTLLEKRLYGAEQADQHSSPSMVVEKVYFNQAGTIARQGSLSVGESSVNITEENNLITKRAYTEVSPEHSESREGANMFHINRDENEGLPRKMDLAKHTETVDYNLSCILDRKDLNSLMADLNLGPRINKNSLFDRDRKQVLSREGKLSLEH